MSLDSSREKTGQQSKGPAVPPPLPQERRSPPREIAVTKTATRVQRTEEPTERATTDTSAELTEALVVEDATSPSSSAAVAGRLHRNSQESDYLLISRRRIQAYVLLLIGTGLMGFCWAAAPPVPVEPLPQLLRTQVRNPRRIPSCWRARFSSRPKENLSRPMRAPWSSPSRCLLHKSF